MKILEEKPKKNNAEGNLTLTSVLNNDPMVPLSEVPLSEVLGKLPLPLPWEIVAAYMSRCDNEAAWGFHRGGGEQ